MLCSVYMYVSVVWLAHQLYVKYRKAHFRETKLLYLSLDSSDASGFSVWHFHINIGKRERQRERKREELHIKFILVLYEHGRLTYVFIVS